MKANVTLFRNKLVSEKNKLISGMSTEGYISEGGDVADVTSQRDEYLFQKRLDTRSCLYLRKVENSLYRIDAGKYFTCEECEEEISPARLRARPTATVCISCKEDMEVTESTTMSGNLSTSYSAMTRH